MTRKAVWFGLALTLLLTLPAHALAQAGEGSRWGAIVSFVPAFEVKEDGWLKDLSPHFFAGGEDGFDIEGADFRVGFVRGSSLGGDFGVSFVRRSLKETSRTGAREEFCFGVPLECLVVGTEYHFLDVSLTGVEAHKFTPFVTIRDRVQVGLDVAGGIGQYRGTAERVSTVFDDSGSATVVTDLVEARELNELRDKLSVVPLFRLELAVAGVLPGGLKLRGSGGINFPGQHAISLSVIYLFGAR